MGQEKTCGNDIYHRFVRPYGLRYYEYVINDTEKVGDAEHPYTGFLLNGKPYLLRGCCMHDDIDGKANALDDNDYTQTFNIIQEILFRNLHEITSHCY